jgi:hypothetical protein
VDCLQIRRRRRPEKNGTSFCRDAVLPSYSEYSNVKHAGVLSNQLICSAGYVVLLPVVRESNFGTTATLSWKYKCPIQDTRFFVSSN